jgi:hypothetical protein
MKKIIKITSVFVGLFLILFVIGYFAIAFYEMNLDISMWGKPKRGALLFFCLCYLCFTPLILSYLDEKIN